MDMHYSDFLEKQVGETLNAAGIKFDRTHQRIDFYLPDQEVYIEVKQYHSDRSAEQLKTQDNIILLQGKKAVNLFCNLVKNQSK